MTIRLLEPAQRELDEAAAWYADQAPGLGDAFLIEAVRVFRLIEGHPQAWNPIAVNIRRCRFSRFPYAAVYAPEDEGILVVAIAHLHRKPEYWRDRLRALPD